MSDRFNYVCVGGGPITRIDPEGYNTAIVLPYDEDYILAAYVVRKAATIARVTGSVEATHTEHLPGLNPFSATWKRN